MEEYLSEKEQWERVLAWLREQGPWMLTTVIVVFAAFGGWRWWQAHGEQRDLAAEARYQLALADFGRNDFSDGLKVVDTLVKDAPHSPYASQAQLAAARVEVQSSQLDQAVTRLNWVLRETRDPEMALLTRLRLARVQLAQNKPDAALQTLQVSDAGAFAARYAEQRGDILLAKGDRDGALKAYRAARIAGDETVDTSLLDLKIQDLAHS